MHTHTTARLEFEERIACELHEQYDHDIVRLTEIDVAYSVSPKSISDQFSRLRFAKCRLRLRFSTG